MQPFFYLSHFKDSAQPGWQEKKKTILILEDRFNARFAMSFAFQKTNKSSPDLKLRM